MKKHIKTGLLLCLCATFSNPIFSQTKKTPSKDVKKEVKETANFHVETNDGNDYIGTKISEDKDVVKMNTTKLGDITIKKSDIKKMEDIAADRVKEGEYLFENPNSTRYLFAPSAYALKKGEGYYQNTLVAFNQVSFGFTDKFTVGLGTMPLFLFNKDAANASPFWITPKYTFGSQDKKANFAVGGIYMFFPFIDKKATGGSVGSFGILYGAGTFGNRDKNVSVGLGWGFARSSAVLNSSTNGQKTIFGKRPTLNISGMYRFAKRSYFVSENWFLTVDLTTIAAFSGAYRFTGKNISVDLGVITARAIGLKSSSTNRDLGVPFIPWAGIVIPFTIKSYSAD